MKKFISLSAAVLLIFALSACSSKKVNPNAVKIIDAMMNCPNSELFDPETVIELGTGKEPDLDKIKAIEETVSSNWEKAVGGCFSEKYFDTFLTNGGATAYHMAAYMFDTTYSVEEIKLKENTDLGQSVTVVLSANGETEDVQIDFALADDGLVKTVSLKDMPKNPSE